MSSIHRIPQSLGAVASFANLEVVFQVSRGAMGLRDMPKAHSWTWEAAACKLREWSQRYSRLPLLLPVELGHMASSMGDTGRMQKPGASCPGYPTFLAP